ncbi:AMP-binding protein, partial [Halorhodospira neutriphila]|uniref:AMP-binding protein n=1 Tax=Halorhodospira neutriphila TaxID=168379 RepID=UPI0019071002
MSGARLECRLAQAARRFPGQPALVTPETSLSFAELDARVSERAAALQSQGIGAGAWVIARTATAVDGVVDWLALLRAGARALPVSGRMPAETLR